MSDGGKSGKPSVRPHRIIGTIIDTPNNDHRNAQVADELYSLSNRRRDNTSSQLNGRYREAPRPSNSSVGSPRPLGQRLTSGRIKSLERSAHWRPLTGGGALKLESSGSRDARSPISPAQGTSKRQRLGEQSPRALSTHTQPQSLFASSAHAAGVRVSELLQDSSKDDDQVLEVMSCNTTDNEAAGGEREALSKPSRLLPLESAHASSHRGDGLPASDSRETPNPATLQGPSLIPDRSALTSEDTEQLVASGRVQRSLAGFSGYRQEPTGRIDGVSLPKTNEFFSSPSSGVGSSSRVGQSPEKLVNQLRPKGHSFANDAEKSATSVPVVGGIAPNLASTESTTDRRARQRLASIYQHESGSLVSPLSSRRRQSFASGAIDLRSPSPPQRPVMSPPQRPAMSPPLKPQSRRPTKASLQGQQQQQQRPANVPAKSISLRGIQIGKYLQVTDVHAASHTKDPASHLKFTIRYLQRTMEISGLRESNELMKISVADISALQYSEQRDLAVMCVVPNVTMESLFEESVFDPACDDTSRCLIYLCWDVQSKSDKTTFLRLQECFDKDVSFSALDIPTFQRYASEFTKPASIDLISSDDDGAAMPTSSKISVDNHAMAIPRRGRDMPAGIGAGSGSVAVKSQYWSSISSIAGDSSFTSIGERTRGKNKGAGDDAMWREPNLYGSSPSRNKAARRTSTPSWFAAEAGSYDLRRTKPVNMAEPPSSVEEGDNSGGDADDFVVRHQVLGVDVSALKFEYPLDGRKSISVVGSDISRLHVGEFLNDTIIEFYMRYIGEKLRTTNAKLYERCFFFNTFFFKKLSQRSRAMVSHGDNDPMGLVYSQLKKWTASVDLFDKDYIFVPINENIHWYLAIITNPHALLSSGPEASDSCPNGSAAIAASSLKPASPPAVAPTLDLPPPSPSATSSLPSSGPTPAPQQEPSQPVLEDGNGHIDVEMTDAPAVEDDTTSIAAQAQVQPTPLRPGLTLSTSELEAGLDLNAANASGKPSQQQGVIDLSLSHEAEIIDLGMQKSKVKYVDPETTSSILILDSLGNRHQSTFGLLRGYMQAEANFRHYSTDVAEAMVGKYAKVPLQNNLCDCGVFLLCYIESFLKDPTAFMSLALNGADIRDWFDPGQMRQKRGSMLRLAIRLANEHGQLQKSKADAKEPVRDDGQQPTEDMSEGSDQPSDTPPLAPPTAPTSPTSPAAPAAPAVSADGGSSATEPPRSADDTE